jgi:hypothetical protein
LFMSSLFFVAGCGAHVGIQNERLYTAKWAGKRTVSQCNERSGHKRHMTIRCERINIESR